MDPLAARPQAQLEDMVPHSSGQKEPTLDGQIPHFPF